MKKITAYLNYSSFGNYIKEFPLEDVCDKIEIQIPDWIDVWENNMNLTMIEFPHGYCYQLDECSRLKAGDDLYLVNLMKDKWYRVQYSVA